MAIACLLYNASAWAQFSTVINLPPDAAPTSIGSDTQLNVSDGGSLPSSFSSRFQAGASDGSSTNVEVNISGGTVGSYFNANAGSIINITGGAIGDFFTANAGSQVEILGGELGGDFAITEGADAFIRGGVFAGFTSGSGSGAFDITDGELTFLSLGEDRLATFHGGTMESASMFDRGHLVMTGGIMNSAEVIGHSSLIIDGGMVTGGVFVDFESSLQLLNGEIEGARVTGNEFIMSGGSIGPVGLLLGSSTAKISGGSVAGRFHVGEDVDMELMGSSFLLDGQPIPGLVGPGSSVIVPQRDGALLTGVLSDGSSIDLELNDLTFPQLDGVDYFSSDSTLRLTIIPEPTTLVLLALTTGGLLARRAH